MLRRCSKCSGRFPETEFYADRKSGLRRQCKECHRARVREYKQANPEKVKASMSKWYDKHIEEQREARNDYMREYNRRPEVMEKRKAFRDKDKREAFEHYGGAVCQCCKETELSMLNLDHVAGGGNRHRRELSTKDVPHVGNHIYVWARLKGYPKIFRVLCYNCNLASARYNGICPHQLTSQEMLGLVIESDGDAGRIG